MNPSSPEASLHAGFALGIEAARRSNPRGLDSTVTRLFEEFRTPLYRYLVLVTWNPGESEDLVQETFVRLLGYLNSGKSIDNLRAWLFRVAHNLAANRLRSERTIESLSEDHITRDVESRLSGAVPSPEMLFLQKEKHMELGSVIERLPAQQRYCLFLRREGLRYREIASILGMGETTVLDHIHRAIERIERELHVR